MCLESRVEGADNVKVGFLSSFISGIFVRTVNTTHLEYGAAEVVAELTRRQWDKGEPPSLLLMAYRPRHE